MYKLNGKHEIHVVVAKSYHKVLKQMARACKEFDRNGGVVISVDVLPFEDGNDYRYEGLIVVDNSLA
jgi:hypothetical protein